MVKYTSRRYKRKSLRRTRRKIPKTTTTTTRRRRIIRRGGYSPIGENGGNYGVAPVGYPVQQSGALPDPKSAFPDGPSAY